MGYSFQKNRCLGLAGFGVALPHCKKSNNQQNPTATKQFNQPNCSKQKNTQFPFQKKGVIKILFYYIKLCICYENKEILLMMNNKNRNRVHLYIQLSLFCSHSDKTLKSCHFTKKLAHFGNFLKIHYHLQSSFQWFYHKF